MGSLLETDEDMEVQIVYLNQEAIAEHIDVLNKVCNNVIENKGYYKLRKRMVEQNISDVYYIDPETNTVVCKLKALVKQTGVQEVEEPEVEEEPESVFNETIDMDKAKNLLLSYIKIEDTKISYKEITELEDVSTGDEVEVIFKIYPRMEFEDLKSKIILSYDNGTIVSLKKVSLSDMNVNESSIEKFYIEIPEGTEEEFVIIFELFDNEGMILSKEYDIEVQMRASKVRVINVEPSPEGKIEPGKVLSIDVKLKNSGNEDAENLNLTAEINELDISDSYAIEELKDGETDTFDLFFRIPGDTDEDTYRVDINVYDEEGEKIDEEDFRIEVID